MLLPRSIATSHLCVLILYIATVQSQYSDYHVNDDSDDHDHDHSSYREVDDRPDYSKYYQVESSSSPLAVSAPLLAGNNGAKELENGFVSPLDFSGFIGSSHFGLAAASNVQKSLPTIPISNPFHIQETAGNGPGFASANLQFNPQNFEKEAQKISSQFALNSFGPKPDQTYVAPKLESTAPQNEKYNKKIYSEVDDLNGYAPATYNKYESQGVPAQKENYEKNSGYTKPKFDYSAVTPSLAPYTPIVPTLSTYTAAGKNSYTSPAKLYTPQYFPTAKHTNAQSNVQPNLAPYQKYSFQPVGALPVATFQNIQSTLAPFKPSTSYVVPSTAASYSASPTEYTQPSEYNAQKVNSNCQRIEKQLSPDDISHGRFKRQADAMNCFVCKDPKSGGNYEQCSYTSNPDNDKSYFHGHAEKYSTKTYSNPEHSRRKRAAKDARNKHHSHYFSSKPEQFDHDKYYKAPDFSHYEKVEEYGLDPEYFPASTQQEKSYSELKSEELKKDGANCKKVEKGSTTCMVCSNPKTGGNYEQCSYTFEPKETKYAYVKEKKFNSNDPDGEEKTVESTETKPTIEKSNSRLRQKPTTKSTDEIPYHYSATTKHPKQTTRKSKGEYYEIPKDLYREGESTEKQEKVDLSKKHEDYVSKLFPEYTQKESRNQETKQHPGYQYKSDLPEYFTAEESKKDVDSVLQEFTKKDRSKCKKIAKNKMTCYLCVDAKGIQHEECMFVSESQPKSSHIAYHEVKEFSTDPKRSNGEAASSSSQSEKIVPTTATKLKRKIFPKKVTTTIPIIDVEAEPAEYIQVEGKTPRIVRRKTNISKEYLGQESRNSEVKVAEPKQQEEHVNEPEYEGAEGLYASELVPKYSDKLGMTLPVYMLQISEGEKIFDEVMASGR
ncbi:hypothetical protein CBL_11978 [Carabus blaptoides fortunei]